MRFIESILLKDGAYHNLSLHQKRVDRTFEQFMPKLTSHDLERILPKLALNGSYKVRLIYGTDVPGKGYEVEYAEYIPRSIQSLQIMPTPTFDYSFKYENREQINSLVSKSNADDIIISVDGMITDGSYFNLVFWDGQEWVTPHTHLLNGVRRQQLLLEGKIKEAPISLSELGAFKKVSLINAMLDLGAIELTMNQILKG